MAQQINLLTPILLKPRRHFTATAMVQALLLILVGSLLLAAWIHSRAGQRRLEFQARSQALQPDAGRHGAGDQGEQVAVPFAGALPAAAQGLQQLRLALLLLAQRLDLGLDGLEVGGRRQQRQAAGERPLLGLQ
ncbi:MAG TPA: hypothetical protein VK195_06725, partial [Burkholderiaceae bacterium]|nr:hypothetical protein [Burkholderiaceae bacterium]